MTFLVIITQIREVRTIIGKPASELKKLHWDMIGVDMGTSVAWHGLAV